MSELRRFIVDAKDEDPQGDLVYYSDYEHILKLKNESIEALEEKIVRLRAGYELTDKGWPYQHELSENLKKALCLIDELMESFQEIESLRGCADKSVAEFAIKETQNALIKIEAYRTEVRGHGKSFRKN